jgi:Ni/Co efflux regulator RcnB
MKKLILVIAALALLPASVAAQQQSAEAEREAVKQAVLDYVEGIYMVDASRIERSVHPELAKRGFFVKKDETAYSSAVMTFQQLVDLAKTYNKNGRVPKDAPKEVVIFDVSDQTASAKLTAVWGIDYIHLAKYDGKWKFINVLWQSPPKTMK